MTILRRIDNVFYNTTDVSRLAAFHAQVLGCVLRRQQAESPGLMWSEINVGGMELSFRLAGGTVSAHPELAGDFLEVAPGRGATISFEVSDTDAVRNVLSSRGVKFRGPPISCTGGKEIISIFEDPFGRPVQLYEPRFTDPADAMAAAGRTPRAVPTAPPAASAAPMFASNLRDVRNLALSVSFYVNDIKKARDFYRDVLELPLRQETARQLVFMLDDAVIEFRHLDTLHVDDVKLVAPGTSGQDGGILAVEVRNAATAAARTTSLGITSPVLRTDPAHTTAGRRSGFRDADGNYIEFWERPHAF